MFTSSLIDDMESFVPDKERLGDENLASEM